MINLGDKWVRVIIVILVIILLYWFMQRPSVGAEIDKLINSIYKKQSAKPSN